MTIYEINKLDGEKIKYDLLHINSMQTKGERATITNSIEVRILCIMRFENGKSSSAILQIDLFNNKISPNDYFSINGFIEVFIRFRKVACGLLSSKFYNEMIHFYNSLSDENKLLLEVYE